MDLTNYIAPSADAENNRMKAATGNGITTGLSVLLFINYLSVIFNSVFQYNNQLILESHLLEMKVMRIYFCITFMAIGLGLDSYIFEKRKLNYIFILELPPAKVTASYRSHLKICMMFLAIISVCCTMAVCRIFLDEKRLDEAAHLSF